MLISEMSEVTAEMYKIIGITSKKSKKGVDCKINTTQETMHEIKTFREN